MGMAENGADARDSSQSCGDERNSDARLDIINAVWICSTSAAITEAGKHYLRDVRAALMRPVRGRV
jgi:hypothetical protein